MRPYPFTFTPQEFWARVDLSEPGGCWPWKGKPDRYGYCHVRNGRGKQPRAHRVAWHLTYGLDPGEKYVCHTCDNRRCCRPSHLFLGTARDNTLDMHAKGRGVVPEPLRGEHHPNSKLSDEERTMLRDAYLAGVNKSALSRVFGVSRPVVSKIVGV